MRGRSATPRDCDASTSAQTTSSAPRTGDASPGVRGGRVWDPTAHAHRRRYPAHTDNPVRALERGAGLADFTELESVLLGERVEIAAQRGQLSQMEGRHMFANTVERFIKQLRAVQVDGQRYELLSGLAA
jgi:hypothetical protein